MTWWFETPITILPCADKSLSAQILVCYGVDAFPHRAWCDPGYSSDLPAVRSTGLPPILHNIDEAARCAALCSPAGRSSDGRERFMFSGFLGDLLDIFITLIETLSG
ncbi:hypothetical protein [Nocardia sp. NPDC051833]|uniref:hypothetical protein n=1 Tax=Nocardia sp. NPDC051833 TaxID=3155674 RepID=UPI00342ED524